MIYHGEIKQKMATYDVIVASVLLLRTIKGLISELYQILCFFTVLNHIDENIDK